MSRHRLLFTADRQRFFLVPPDTKAPTGELVVHSLQGTTDQVDEAWIAEHEVERDAARAHVDAGWERTIGKVRDAWRELIGAPAVETPPDLSRWPGGVSPGAVVTDPERGREARRNLLQGAGRLLGGWDDERVDAAEQRLDTLGEKAREGAATVRQAADKLGGELRESAPAVEKTFEEVGRGLSELAGTLVESLRSKARERTTAAPPPSDETDEGGSS